MNFQSLYILLPCHSLEDFPTHFIGDEATGLLENWIAIWHPTLIKVAGATPKWHRAEELPESLDNSLLVVPEVSQTSLPDDYEASCADQNAFLIQGHLGRDTILESALKHLDIDETCEPDLAADFYALGYGFLQVQLMTRQLRYSSNLDESRFEALVVEAANAINESAKCVRDKIQSCFDLLLEEKSRYYPVEANLVDLTLLAETTLGKSLREQLNRDFPQNLLLTGNLCEKLSTLHGDSFDQVVANIGEGKLHIVGGNQSELPDPLISSDSLIRNILEGQSILQSSLGMSASVYARRSNGLTPVLPEILEKLGYRGVLHATLDEGRFPTGLAANTRWEAPSGESLIALTRTPRDANVSETFIDLGIKIGEAIDSEHYATVVFAHWPNKFNRVFEDLLRIHRYGPLLGNFVSFGEHFDSVYDPGYGESQDATKYRNAYLQQAIAKQTPDPISRYVRYWDRTWRLRELQNLQLLTMIHNKTTPPTHEAFDTRIDLDLIENCDQQLDEDINDSIVKCLESIKTPGTNTTVINALAFPRLASVSNQDKAAPSSKVEAIHVRDHDSGASQWVVNCPPFGHCELIPDHQSRKTKIGPPVIGDGQLQNEFFQLRIDESTGGLRGLKLYDRRTNLLTQRLAMRSFSGHPKLDSPEYATMSAKKIDFVSQTKVSGKAVSLGEIVLNEKVVAEFQQTISVHRGSRIIEFEIELDSIRSLSGGNGWDNYYCSRIAWAEENAKLRRELHAARYVTNERRFCAPQFIEIDDMETKLTLIAGGLPFHQRSGARQLDSLLICAGESARKFRFAIAVNEKYSSQAVATWHTPVRLLPHTKIDEQSSGWLFHLSSKNVQITLCRQFQTSDSKLTGVHFRLQETEGRRGEISIHCPYKVKSAQLVDLRGEVMENLKVDSNQVKADFLGSQMFDIHINW